MQELQKHWKSRNHFKYLSSFERCLNRSLWALLWGVLTFLLLQHVFLAKVPELFPHGAQLGDLLFNIGIGYVGAFTFYLLNVRVPLRRDRRNIYRHLAPLLDRLVGVAISLMSTLNTVAKVDPTRSNSLENIEDTCSKIAPGTEVTNMVVPALTPSGMRRATVMDAVQNQITRSRAITRELLSFSQYLSSDLVSQIAALDSCTHFMMFDHTYQMYTQGRLANTDLAAWTTSLFDYLLLVDDIDKYTRENEFPELQPDPRLISGTERRSDAVPLSRRRQPPSV
jgi:hypothetical protein